MKNLKIAAILALAGGASGGAGCDVSVGDCDRDDAGQCKSLFDDEDASVGSDGGLAPDASADGAASDAGSNDGATDAAMGDSAMNTPDSSLGQDLPLAEFCRLANAVGLAWDTKLNDLACCTAADYSSEAARSILALFFYSDTSTDDCIMRNQPLIDSSKVEYDGRYAEACAAQFAAAFEMPPAMCPADGFELQALRAQIGHGAAFLTQIDACRDMLRGKTAASGECASHFECGKGYSCQTARGGGSGAVKTCTLQGQGGFLCADNNDCQSGFDCVGQASAVGGKTCRNSLVTNLGSCGVDRECEKGLVCELVDEAQNKFGCVAPTPGTPICR